MRLHIDHEVGILFRKLLQIPEGCQIFTNQFQLTHFCAEKFIDAGLKVTGICTDEAWPLDHPEYETEDARGLTVTDNKDLALFNPLDKFHVGFSAFPFAINNEGPEKNRVKPLTIQDRLQFFKCSEGHENRETAYHLLGLEQMLAATLPGGYFGAVLPKRWVGREMKYMRWWWNEAALIAQIKLPELAVRMSPEYNPEDGVLIDSVETNAPGEWLLYIWNRPLGEDSKYRQLGYARHRFSPFVFPLEMFRHTDELVTAFQASEWYNMSLIHWHDAIESLHTDMNWGTFKNNPLGVDDPKDIYFFNPRPDFQTGLRIVQDVNEIATIKHAVHVKPGRVFKISTQLDPRLQTAQEAANQCALLDLRARLGSFTDDRDGNIIFNYDHELKSRPFMDIRDKMVSAIEEQGLVPCMTQDEHHKMLKKERWLNIQLAPIERVIPVTKAATGTEKSTEADWEMAYEDMGMWATFPEIMQMWSTRAKQMGMDRHCFDFQFNDLIYYAAKQCLANCSVMGLGKTRLSLFAAILRCAKHSLFIVPAKLIGVWQDEIDNTIVPYCRFQRKDWQGNVLQPTYQVIEHARDLLPTNLKTFNIISYDKAKLVARDGKFYKCPKCGTVVYSGKPLAQPPICPGDSALEQDDLRRCNNMHLAWKRLCAGPEYQGEAGERYAKRKIRVLHDGTGEPFVNDKGEYHRVHFTKLTDHAGEKFPLESTVVIDQRPLKPKIPVMVEQDNMFKKMVRRPIGYDENRHTGERKVVYDNVEKGMHLRWTIAHMLRNRFQHVFLDEALYIMNDESMRGAAVNCINGPQRVINTGTPFKNYPQNILALFNWCFPREVFPDYRSYDKYGKARFLKKYSTEVYVGGTRLPDGQIIGGKPKQVPKINNAELFQAEFAPMMLRHVRNEPIVIKDIPHKVLIENHMSIDMDSDHRAYYKKWLDKFADWWMKMKQEEEDKKVREGSLLAKLGYLWNGSTNPHFMLDGILSGEDEDAKAWAREIGVYKGPVPAKMKKAWEMIRANVAAGDKTIISSLRRDNLKLGQNWCEKVGLASMIVDGTISLALQKSTGRSKRHEMVEQFRHYNYHCMWAGLEALAEGFNIPEANHAILLDCGWAPSGPRQLIGRMLRPQQKKIIYADYLMHKGTIDDYMFALSYLKGRAADEAIDYIEFDDFSTEIIPDISQYADSIVDGTEEKKKQAMWLIVDHLKRQTQQKIEQEGEDAA